MTPTDTPPPLLAETTELLDPRTLTPHPKNTRQGDRPKIRESMRHNGWFGTVTVQKSTGYIIVGNHRVEIAIELGLPLVKVETVDIDDAWAERILIADNHTSDSAGYDVTSLADLLSSMKANDNLLGTGRDAASVDALLESIKPPPQVEVAPRADRTHRRVVLVVDDATYTWLEERLALIVETESHASKAAAVVALAAAWKPKAV